MIFLNDNRVNALAGRLAREFGAPLLMPYINWMLKVCVDNGITKLYFIARDGFVLKIIADAFIKKYQYNIVTNYIYGSRRVWRIAYYMQDDFCVSRFLDESYPNKIISKKKLASVFQIAVEEINTYLPKYYQQHGDNWDIKDLYFIKFYLDKSAEFRVFLKEKHFDFYKRIKGYLIQEIQSIADNVAFVDCVGTGFTLRGMEKFFDLDTPVNAFYYYQHNTNKREYHSFVDKPEYSSILMEILCRSCEGQTVDYDYKNDKYIPVFENYEVKHLIEHGYEIYLEEMKRIAEASDEVGIEFDKNAWHRFSSMSDIEILNYIGDCPYGVTGSEHKLCTFAPVIDKDTLLKVLKYGEGFVEKVFYKGGLWGYSVLRSGKIIKKILVLARRCRILNDLQKRKRESIELNITLEGFFSIYPNLKGKKLLIYGAGYVGTYITELLLASDDIVISAWVDKSPRVNDTFPILDINSISNMDYDYVLIAILREEIVQEVKEMLLNMNVPSEKILN